MKNVLIFFSGLVVGAAVAAVVTYERLTTRFDEELERAYAKADFDRVQREHALRTDFSKRSIEKETEDANQLRMEYVTDAEDGDTMSGSDEYFAEMQAPPDDREIELIEVNEFDLCINFNKTTITYYMGDNVLVDENDEPIDDIEGTVSCDLLAWFENSKHINTMYVRNHNLSIDYEVVKVMGAYGDLIGL